MEPVSFSVCWFYRLTKHPTPLLQINDALGAGELGDSKTRKQVLKLWLAACRTLSPGNLSIQSETLNTTRSRAAYRSGLK